MAPVTYLRTCAYDTNTSSLRTDASALRRYLPQFRTNPRIFGAFACCDQYPPAYYWRKQALSYFSTSEQPPCHKKLGFRLLKVHIEVVSPFICATIHALEPDVRVDSAAITIALSTYLPCVLPATFFCPGARVRPAAAALPKTRLVVGSAA